MKKIDINEEFKLRWPDGVDRTRINQLKSNKAWGKNTSEYKTLLGAELDKMGATSILITRSDNERLDSGVAVWFSMVKEDFSWQQTLGIENPAPTMEQIDTAFRDRARKVHPDSPGGGDPEMFKKLNEARIQAKSWITETHNHRHEFVMAIDQYREARLNLCAIRLALSHIRGLERVGAPAVLKQTLGAFRAKLTGGVPNGPVST